MTYTAPSSLTIGDVVTETIWDTVIEGNWNHLATESTGTLFLGVTSSTPTYKAPPPVGNMLINGGLVAWPRGYGSFDTDGYWTADPWHIVGDNMTVTADSDTTALHTINMPVVASISVTGTGNRYHEQRVYKTWFNYWPSYASLWMLVNKQSGGACSVYVGDGVTTTETTVTGTGWQVIKVEGVAISASSNYIKVGIHVAAAATIQQGWACLVPLTKGAPYYPSSGGGIEELIAVERLYETLVGTKMDGTEGSFWFSAYVSSAAGVQSFACPIAFTVAKPGPDFGLITNLPTVDILGTVTEERDSPKGDWTVGRGGASDGDFTASLDISGVTHTSCTIRGKTAATHAEGQASIRAWTGNARVIASFHRNR